MFSALFYSIQLYLFRGLQILASFMDDIDLLLTLGPTCDDVIYMYANLATSTLVNVM